MLTQRQHLLGIALLLLSFSWLFVLPWLPLKVHKNIHAELLPHNHGDYALVFFGFPGCTDICPSSLQAMADIQQRYQHIAPSTTVDLVFVNLMAALPHSSAFAYAQKIHPNFIVYPHSADHLEPLIKQFGAQLQGNEANIWQHSGYIYLLKNVSETWQIHYIYRNAERFKANALNDIKSLQK